MHFRKVSTEACLLFLYCHKKRSHFINSIHWKHYVTVSAFILAEKTLMFLIRSFCPELAKMNAPNVITLQKITMKRECCYHNETDTLKIFYSKPLFLHTTVTCWQWESVFNVFCVSTLCQEIPMLCNKLSSLQIKKKDEVLLKGDY